MPPKCLVASELEVNDRDDNRDICSIAHAVASVCSQCSQLSLARFLTFLNTFILTEMFLKGKPCVSYLHGFKLCVLNKSSACVS